MRPWARPWRAHTDAAVAECYVWGAKTKGLCEEPIGGFPGGSVVKNLPAKVGDMSSVPDLGRAHMPGSN